MTTFLEDLDPDELDTIAEAYDLNLTWGQDTITRNR